MKIKKVLGGVAVSILLLGCKGGEEVKEQVKGPGGSVYVQPEEGILKTGANVISPNENSEFGKSFYGKNYDKARKILCGESGCLTKLKQDKTPEFNHMVVLVNSLLILQKLDRAINTLSGFLGQLGSPKLQTKQEDVVDTLLNLVDLNKSEIIQLTEEVAQGVENLRSVQDVQKYVVRVKTLQITIGSGLTTPIIDASFKDVYIRYDVTLIVGAVAKALQSIFLVIDSHDTILSISDIISNISQILSDLNNDPFGFILRIPSALKLDKFPNFLKFKEGGEAKWKGIPEVLKTAFTWAMDGVKFLFNINNSCPQGKNVFVCVSDNKLKFGAEKLNVQGKDWREVSLPEKFSSQNLINYLGSAADVFKCPNEIKVGIKNILDAIDAIMGTEDFKNFPNFMRINFCSFFGANNNTPKPLRDLIFPVEKTAYGQYSFAIEFEIGHLYGFKVTDYSGKSTTNIEVEKIYVNAPTFSSEATSFISVTGGILIVPDNLYQKVITIGDNNFKGPVTYLFKDATTTTAIIIPKYVEGKKYITVGDGKHFEEFANEISKDYFHPVTSFISPKLLVYPKDVIPGLGDLLKVIGRNYLLYILFKDPTFNGSVEIDFCSVWRTFMGGNPPDNFKGWADKLNERYNCSQSDTSEKFITPTHQSVNDLLGIGLTAIGLSGLSISPF